MQINTLPFPGGFTIMFHVSWPHVENSKFPFWNLLVQWIAGVLVVRCDKAAPLPPSSPLPWSPIPWGKVPSKNLLGHQKLIGPTPRPSSHWLEQQTLTQNYFEAQSSFSSCISGQGAAMIFVLEIIFETIFVLEITQHRFSSANSRAHPTRGLQPHKSRPPQASNTYFAFWRNISCTFCSFQCEVHQARHWGLNTCPCR